MARVIKVTSVEEKDVLGPDGVIRRVRVGHYTINNKGPFAETIEIETDKTEEWEKEREEIRKKIKEYK